MKSNFRLRHRPWRSNQTLSSAQTAARDDNLPPRSFQCSRAGNDPPRTLTLAQPSGQDRGVIDVVCGVIEDSKGRFLACLRPEGWHLGGLWEFPGGKVEPGESPETALVRELMEELAIRVEVGAALGPVEWHYPRGPIRLLAFRCRILEGAPHPHEHEKLIWCAAEDFGKLAWADADVPVLDQLSASIAARAGDPFAIAKPFRRD